MAKSIVGGLLWFIGLFFARACRYSLPSLSHRDWATLRGRARP